MEHFLNVIEDKDTGNDLCTYQVIKDLYMKDEKPKGIDSSERAAVELDYDINTTFSSLNKNMDYYNITTMEYRKELRKLDKVKRIVDFETCEDNKEEVKKRKRFWEYVSELKHITIDL